MKNESCWLVSVGWVRGSDLVLGAQGGIGDVRGEVGVVDGTERQAVRPAATEVGEVDVLWDGNRRVIRLLQSTMQLATPSGKPY